MLDVETVISMTLLDRMEQVQSRKSNELSIKQPASSGFVPPGIASLWICDLSSGSSGVTYILSIKREGRTGRSSARGLDNTDLAQRGLCKNKTESRYSLSTVRCKLGK